MGRLEFAGIMFTCVYLGAIAIMFAITIMTVPMKQTVTHTSPYYLFMFYLLLLLLSFLGLATKFMLVAVTAPLPFRKYNNVCGFLSYFFTRW